MFQYFDGKKWESGLLVLNVSYNSLGDVDVECIQRMVSQDTIILQLTSRDDSKRAAVDMIYK